MSAQEPNFLAWNEIWCRPTLAIGGHLHSFPGLEELSLKSILSIPKLRHVGIGCRGSGVGGWREEGHAGMEAIVGEEWGESGSCYDERREDIIALVQA